MHHRRPTATLVFRDSPLFYQTGWILGGLGDWNSSFASMLAGDSERVWLGAFGRVERGIMQIVRLISPAP